MKNLTILSFIITSLIILSCKKENTSLIVKQISLAERILEFQTVIRKNYSGVLTLENTQVGFNVEKKRCAVEGKFLSEGQFKEGQIHFNDKSFNLSDGWFREENPIHQDLFGKKISVGVRNVERDPTEAEFYIPAGLISEYLGADLNFVPDFTVNSDINWNEDIENLMGVYLIITYEPSFNLPKIGEIKNTSTNKYIHTDDTGTYKLKPEDLSDIPTDAIIFVQIIRGDYRVVESNEEEYLIYGKSEIQGFAKKK